MKAYYTANQLIDEALAGVRCFDRKYYGEAAMYFARGYRDFELFQDFGSIKEAWLPITAINTVNYPTDAMRIVSIGVETGKELFTFTKADNMISPITSSIDEALDSDRGEDDTIDRNPTHGYGAKANNLEYYYKDDKAKRRIVLGRMALDQTRFANRSEVLVRYVSNGIDNLDTTYIPNEAANLLIAYIEHKLVQSMPDKYTGQYRAEKREDYIEARNMYDALNMPSLDELIDVIYESSGQNVRRP